jgi:hypothetical protein
MNDSLAKQAGSSGLSAITSYARGDLGGVFSSLTKFGQLTPSILSASDCSPER